MKRYPDYPGHGGGDTSREAADSMAPHVNRLQAIALGAIHGAVAAALAAWKATFAKCAERRYAFFVLSRGGHARAFGNGNFPVCGRRPDAFDGKPNRFGVGLRQFAFGFGTRVNNEIISAL